MEIWTRRENPRFLSTLTLVWAGIFILGILHFLLAFVLEPRIHMIFGVVFLLLSFTATAVLAWGWEVSRRELAGTRHVLEDRSRERDLWQARVQEIQAGVGQAIDQQMDEWRLTPAEKAVTLMLLKGYSHKEIASLTERSERTVRQQAVDVYRKSGLHGRAELSAFFLEDLLVPAADPEGGTLP